MMNTTTIPSIERFQGPAGVRIVLAAPGGFWRIQRECGPFDDDPLEPDREDAVKWAQEIVNRKGKPLPLPEPSEPRRISPNENVDQLAKTRLPPGVLGRYDGYSKPAKRGGRR